MFLLFFKLDLQFGMHLIEIFDLLPQFLPILLVCFIFFLPFLFVLLDVSKVLDWEIFLKTLTVDERSPDFMMPLIIEPVHEPQQIVRDRECYQITSDFCNHDST